MHWRRMLLYVATVTSSLLPLDDAARQQEIPVSDSSMAAKSRLRRSPLSWPFEPRALRRLSSTEIDAFNEGLHSKRPKFIGKRGLPSPPSSSCRLDAFGNCVPDDDDVAAAEKRGPRKFMGKKSDDDPAGEVEMLQRVTRGRKFVGKRQHRKFLGRRAELDHLLMQSSLSSNSNRQPRRKFVG